MNPDDMEDDGLGINDAGLEIDLDEPYNILEVSDESNHEDSHGDSVSRAYPLSRLRNCMEILRSTWLWNSRRSTSISGPYVLSLNSGCRLTMVS